jgi:hypothetical protein
MIPGKMEFSVKMDDGGHFEKGKWVTMFTPLLEHLGSIIDIDKQEFEIVARWKEPIFKIGACIGYSDHEKSLGIFTQRQVMEMLPRIGNGTFPEGADLIPWRGA